MLKVDRDGTEAIPPVQLRTEYLRVDGMDCASCAAPIERALSELNGVDDVQVDVVGGRVRVKYSESAVRRDDIAGAIRRIGYGVGDAVEPGISTRGGEEASSSILRRRSRFITATISGLFLGLGVASNWIGGQGWIGIAALGISSVAGGWFVFPQGLRAARNRSLDMNFLMAIAAVGAWLIGEQAEAAATLFLFSVAEMLESFSMDRARNAIKALMDLSPAEATVRRSGGELRVPVADVAVGETVVVRPGEKISVDGEVITGRSSVNQAAITGESMPVDKEQGAEVFAGTFNGHGTIDVRSTKPASDTTLARIVHAVEDAQATRAPSQTFVDRFTRIYTPAVVIGALLIAILPPLFGAGTWETWIYRALAMLVVACPCALVISTPVTIVSGLTGAASRGILIKGGVHLESAGTISVVCFDKTGTLTEGKPSVTDVVGLGASTEREVLDVALSIELRSEHPLARAILAHGRDRGITAGEADDFEAMPGLGARAVLDGQFIHIGNERLAGELGLQTEETKAVFARFEREAKTAMLVVRDGRPLGFVAIADKVRPHARSAVASLRASGISRVIMLTGDNEGTARAAAAELGITEFHAGLLPSDKIGIVNELENGGHRTAFVGDGVNDAPALAASTLGIAMGAAGTDVAIETADIALMSDDLSRVAETIRISRRTLGIIKQNVFFSIAIKAVFLILALTGVATLWMAVAADMGSSLIVVANGLRARGHQRATPSQAAESRSARF
ncbi:MAG: heavy metal translocating P-type ATPase [Gemmatimonadaceae bacterium]